MHGHFNGRLTVLATVAASLMWLTGCGSDKAEVTLSGSQEPTPVTTSATGTATAELDGDTLTVNGTFSGLSSDLTPVAGSPAHVHKAARGQNGPVLFNLNVTPGTDNRSGSFTATATLSEADREDFREGLLYVNVHTTNNPGGELRGQLEP
jgi:hypothetical protein